MLAGAAGHDDELCVRQPPHVLAPLVLFHQCVMPHSPCARSNAEATPQLAAQVRGLLAAVAGLSTVRRSPVDLLLFLEVSTACAAIGLVKD